MTEWLAANLAQRAARDAMNDAKRLETDARKAAGNCGCTAGQVCRQNAACPRVAVAAGSGS